MKVKTILAALLLVASTGVFAQTAEKKQAVKKTEVSSFKSIDVDAQIDVVLIEDSKPGGIYLVGEEKLFGDIKLAVKDGELQITSRKDMNYKSRITVEVHVNGLEKITVQKEAVVFSGNTIRSGKISVLLVGGGKASLKSSGDISISSGEDTELMVLHKTAGVTVVNK